MFLHANKSTLGNSVEMIGLQLETEKLVLMKLSMTQSFLCVNIIQTGGSIDSYLIQYVKGKL